MAYDSRSVQEPVDRRVAALAAAQHGVFTRAQAMALGMREGMIRHRLGRGRWDRLHRSVYRLAGSTATWRQALMALCLGWGPGAVASHRSAAALRVLPGFEPGPLELIVPRGRERSLPGTIHQPLSLPPGDVGICDGISATTTARTLVDLSAIADPKVLEEALDDALRRKIVSLPQLRWHLRQSTHKRRPGTVAFSMLLDARSDGRRVPQSVLETRVLREMKRAGLPDPVRQYRIHDGTRLVAVVDFAYPEKHVAVEADGYRWHSGRLQWERDLARRNALTSLGWLVIHVTWSELMHRPDAALNPLVSALRQR